MFKTIKDIFEIYTPHEQKRFMLIVGMMFIAAVMETLSIGAVLPFIAIIQNPELITSNTFIASFYETLGLNSYNQLVITFLVIFLLLIIFKNIFSVILNYVYLRFSLNKQASLATRLFSAYLRMDYIEHKNQNSSILVRNVTSETLHVLLNSLLPLAMVISEGLIILCIVGFIFMINPVVALSIAGYGLLLSVLFIYCLRPTMRKLSKRIQFGFGEMIRYSQESFLGIKEIIISNTQQYHTNKFQGFTQGYTRARTLSLAFNQVPRSLFEITFMLIFASTILILMFSDTLATGLPLLGVYAVASFRLIPSLNRCSTAMNQLNLGCASLETIKHDLQKYEKSTGLMDHTRAKTLAKIKQSITLDKVSFKFDETEIIKKLTLSIAPGKIYALTGKSGSGKTTLVDIITGLLKPSSGAVSMDGTNIHTLGRAYMDVISYVPQEVHVADDTVRANIAYGLSAKEIDDDLVWKSLKEANVADVIQAMSEGLDTRLSEKGSRLSGGQKQRIGIARALYAKPFFLIMDEPTAALDKVSEKEMMKSLNKLKKDKIILLVTHSPQVIKASDAELQLINGRIKD